jgi:phospholipid transport system substrate-binding protein
MDTNLMRRSKRLFTALAYSLCAMIFLSCYSMSSAEDARPDAAIARFNAALLDSMKKADTLGYQGRYRFLEPVIKEVFALQFMGNRSLGRHWKKLTPNQQTLFMKTYTEWTIGSYANNFDGYSGEKFLIAKNPTADGETVTVKSSIIKPNGESIVDFNYLMRRISGKWRVVDIRIKGVSQLALTKSDFSSVMNRKGFDSLIASLKEKTAAFSAKDKGKK